ncbi:MAG: acyl carrier protein [Gammaproteobacteria bacterium]
MLDRVLQLMSNVFQVPVESLSEDSSYDTIDQWDSLQHMNLIFAIEEEFGVTLDDEAVADLTSVKRILEVLESAS